MFLFAPPHVHARGHPTMPAVSLWSGFRVRKAPASIDFSDLYSFLAHPHRYSPHSVTVTCKGTRGVTEAVCSGWISTPEIDQPFSTVPAIIAASASLLVDPVPPDQAGVSRDCVQLCIWIKGHFHLVSSKDYILYSTSLATKQRSVKGRAW